MHVVGSNDLAARWRLPSWACSSRWQAGRFAAQPDLKALKEAQSRSVAVAERIGAATVGIINPGLAGASAMGEGSGVVVSEDGLILTVGHVLGKGKGDLTVVLSRWPPRQAKPLGADFGRDAGMAKITDAGKWPHVKIGRIEDLKPGQRCIAVGHPGGIQLNRTPPLRLGRILSLPGKNSPMRFVLSDATVISGDSGGPLFDLDGRVIAIHSNIGLGVTENRHVPIDVYRDKWQDLLAGKQTGEPMGNHVSAVPRLGGPMPDVRQIHAASPAAGPSRRPRGPGHGQRGPGDDHARTDGRAHCQMGKEGQATNGGVRSRYDRRDQVQRLLQDRLIAGDAEVHGLVKNGGLPLTMQQMQDLMKKWDTTEQKPAETKLADGKTKPLAAAPGTMNGQPNPQLLQELMKHAKPDGNGRFKLEVTPKNAKEVMGLMKNLGMNAPPGLAGDPKAGKASPELLAGLTPVAAAASKSTVSVLCDGKPTVLGTVVRRTGYILYQSQRPARQDFLQDRRPRTAGPNRQTARRFRPGTVEGEGQRPDAHRLEGWQSPAGQLAHGSRCRRKAAGRRHPGHSGPSDSQVANHDPPQQGGLGRDLGSTGGNGHDRRRRTRRTGRQSRAQEGRRHHGR